MSTRGSGRSIAIVGVAGRFPGAADVRALWANVLASNSAVREVVPGRWPAAVADMVDPRGSVDHARSSRGCALDPFTLDTTRLALPSALIGRLSPLVKLTLQVGSDAFRSAQLKNVSLSRVGVVLANIALPTDGASRLAEDVFAGALDTKVLGRSALARAKNDPLERYPSALPAGLLARALGLGGGSFTLDAACASSLYALHLACAELEAGRLDAVLAGGVSLPQALYTQVGFTQLQALSASGRCAPFDTRADGLVVGEGAGMVVLRRLDDAQADGEQIRAVIRGIGLSNDVGGSLLSPETEGQLRAMRAAYAEAGWDPDDVDLIECHGTGTPRGDAVELKSLTALWEGRAARGCVLGSVKSNVGHLLTAAGAVGLSKVISALEARTLPPSANFSAATAAEGLQASGFRVLEKPEPWPERSFGRPRRAAVSGFGFGGINAHLLLEEAPTSTSGVQSTSTHTRRLDPVVPPAVAIIGMAAHFGRLDSLTAFQHAIFRGEPVLDARPDDRWLGIDGPAMPGAWLSAIALPAGRFHIPPRELACLLPQQLLMLKVAAEAFDDGGGLGDGPHLRVGAVVGLGLDLQTTSFHLRWLVRERVRIYARELGLSLTEEQSARWEAGLADALSPALDSTRTLGALGGIVASRLAREFQLGGPSFVVSAEEGSGLRALEVATRMLQRGEVDVMLAGAVDLAGDIRQVLATQALRPYSKLGRAVPFDRSADGPTVGEGATAVILKRLDDAIADGDRIYAVVRGFGVAGGAALDSGASRVEAYATAVAQAQREACVTAAQISLVQAHGSGDPTEDRDEASALCRSFGNHESLHCALASTAAIIGQCGAAGSLASVVASALCLFEELLPPMPMFREAADGIELSPSGFHVPREPQVWLRNRAEGQRRAAVSAIGIDGTCMHAVLEGHARSESPLGARPMGERSAAIFLIRADEGALRTLALAHVGTLESLAARWHRRTHAGARVAPAARGLASGPIVAVTRALVASDRSELLRQLERPRAASVPLGGELAFVFPGSGNHFLGMGRTLGAALPGIYRQLDAEVLYLKGHLMPQWVGPWRSQWAEGWEADAARALAGTPERMILGQVAHGVAVSDAARMFGLSPSAYLGYSLGESAGLFASRTWKDRDLMFRRTLASPLFRTELSGPCTLARDAWGTGAAAEWKVVVVNRPAEEVRLALVGTAGLLIVNAPQECVVGGASADVERTVAALGCEALTLEGVPTVHLPLVNAVAAAYRAIHQLPTNPPAGVRFYSGAWARSYVPCEESAADSILANAVGGFDFRATIEQAYADGVRVFLELGPQGSCSRMIARILGARAHVAVTACQRGVDGFRALLLALARLAEAGVPIALDEIYADRGGIAVEPPTPRATIWVPVGGRRPSSPPVPGSTSDRLLGHEAGRGDEQIAHPNFGGSLHNSAASDAHARFLKLAHGSLALQTQALLEQQRLISMLCGASLVAPPQPAAFDRSACLEFAVGSLSKMLGPDFAEVDTFATRVRLPAEPLMLCDRIISVEGTRGRLGPGRCVTEHDVQPSSWYLENGRAPVCISVEAGQADLFLCAYLGIDLQTRGERVYRLLDAKIVFHRDLPRVGETIRYDIKIDRFIRQGDTWLFFFRFDGTIADAPFITMSDGCAGFFSAEQLATGRGIVAPAAETPARSLERAGCTPYAPLLALDAGGLSATQLDALRTGDLAAAFGAAFEGRTLCPALRLPSGRMRLVDRIIELDPAGGSFGLGVVHGEADVAPDAWYLTCHFIDDHVMPGTLMYECCLHTLRVLLLRKGWIAEGDAEVRCEPIDGIASQLRCRGQVTVNSRTVSYRVEIKQMGYDPEPYVLATAAMYVDGRYVVEMEGMSLRIRGLSRAMVEATWATSQRQARARPALYTRKQIVAFCEGNPSEGFGEKYRPFDHERQIARLPRPPFLFIDRVVKCDDLPWVLKPGGWVQCEFDVEPDAWYFAASRQRTMPFAVLAEAALQPCGWLAAYLGSALCSEEDLRFRNLDGAGTAFGEVRPDTGTLTSRTRLIKASQAGGMILQEFEMEILAGTDRVYAGTTGFGFFPAAALAQQVGVRGARLEELGSRRRAFALPREAPLTPTTCAGFAPARGLALGSHAFCVIDRIDALELDGGTHNKGFIAGAKTIDPTEWFFAAHFYQDPVMPGSLGLEALLTLLKVFARERFGKCLTTHRFQATALGHEQQWQYRGQVVPTNREVQVQATLTQVTDGPEPLLIADGLLAVDGRVIYSMKNFALRLVPGDS